MEHRHLLTEPPRIPANGTVLIKVPPKVEKVNGFYIDTSWDSETNTAEKEWKRECDYILNDIIETNERTRRNKMTDREVLDYARKHYPPKPTPKPSLGTDRYNTIHGTVMALPKRLNKNPATGKVPNIEVEIGDEVYFHYLALSNAADWNGKGCMNADWACITYSSIFFAIRNKEIVMINGYVLMEEIEEPLLSKVIVTPDTARKVSTKKAIVRHVPQSSELRDGDVCYFTKHSNVKLEYEMIQTLPKPYLRVREESIVAIE